MQSPCMRDYTSKISYFKILDVSTCYLYQFLAAHLNNNKIVYRLELWKLVESYTKTEGFSIEKEHVLL